MSNTTTFTMPLPLLQWRELQLTSHGTTITAKTLAPVQLSISALSRVLLVCVATTSVAHRLNVGDQVVVSGAAQAEYNRLVYITEVTTTTFTFNLRAGEAPVTPATGTIVGDFQAHAQRAIISVAGGTAVTFGPNVEGDQFSLISGGLKEIFAPAGAKFDLADWYSKSVGLNQAIKVLYI